MRQRLIGWILCFAFAIGMADAATAQSTDRSSSITSRDLERFFARSLEQRRREGNIPGAAVVVVKDGAVVFARGYGWSDIASRQPVSVTNTGFRLGSLSKLFTWTAVMQLVEQGALDLNADIAGYLDFPLPSHPAGPITLRHLMTHTAGFEDVAKDDFKFGVENLRTIGTYLKANVPARIYQPGQMVSYSNYGATLAGYIVERVSGRSFESYAVENIFRPLAMSRASFDQPPSGPISTGYPSAGIPSGFEFIEQRPAGSATGTAADMGRFMISILDNGRGVLRPESVKSMMAMQSFPPGPAPRPALGFFRLDRNGRTIIGHSGDTLAFHSDLLLLPNEKLGLFVVFNGTGSDGAARRIRRVLARDFLDRYFPFSPPPEPTLATARIDAQRVVGHYLSSRRTASALRPVWLLRQSEVTADSQGRLTTGALLGQDGAPLLWREVKPLVYRQLGGQSRLWFITSDDGDIVGWATDEAAPTARQLRVPAHLRNDLVIPLGWGVLAILAAALILGLIRVAGRWRDISSARRALQVGAIVGYALQVASLILWWNLAVAVRGDPLLLGSPLEWWLKLLYGFTALAILGAIIGIVAALEGLVLRGRPAKAVFHFAVLAACGAFMWIAAVFGLASFSARY